MVGEIIKFFRNKNKLTQSQLGEGICTTTHVSKIERGKTAYSDEIILLFSERLSIDLKQEIKNSNKIKMLLQQWEQAIITRRICEMKKMKKNLDKIPFVQSDYYVNHYRLLKARHLLILKERSEAFNIMKCVKESDLDLTPYENNLLLHVYGIYYINAHNNHKNSKTIRFLKEININEYGNPEYYYHLAIGYHLIGSYVLAYSYAKKAMHYFKETNNYGQSINAESLMLVQISRDPSYNFNELLNRYNNLIRDCEVLGFYDKKSILLNNLGFEYFNKEEYELAKKCYHQALEIDDPNTSSYLFRLCNYIDTCLESGNYKKTPLLKKISEGRSLAKKLNSTHFLIFLQLMKLKAEDNTENYYQFLEEKALPHFNSIEHIIYYNRFAEVLLKHYIETNQYKKATKIFVNQLAE